MAPTRNYFLLLTYLRWLCERFVSASLTELA